MAEIGAGVVVRDQGQMPKDTTHQGNPTVTPFILGSVGFSELKADGGLTLGISSRRDEVIQQLRTVADAVQAALPESLQFNTKDIADFRFNVKRLSITLAVQVTDTTRDERVAAVTDAWRKVDTAIGNGISRIESTQRREDDGATESTQGKLSGLKDALVAVRTTLAEKVASYGKLEQVEVPATVPAATPAVTTPEPPKAKQLSDYPELNDRSPAPEVDFVGSFAVLNSAVGMASGGQVSDYMQNSRSGKVLGDPDQEPNWSTFVRLGKSKPDGFYSLDCIKEHPGVGIEEAQAAIEAANRRLGLNAGVGTICIELEHPQKERANTGLEKLLALAKPRTSDSIFLNITISPPIELIYLGKEHNGPRNTGFVQLSINTRILLDGEETGLRSLVESLAAKNARDLVRDLIEVPRRTLNDKSPLCELIDWCRKGMIDPLAEALGGNRNSVWNQYVVVAGVKNIEGKNRPITSQESLATQADLAVRTAAATEEYLRSLKK